MRSYGVFEAGGVLLAGVIAIGCGSSSGGITGIPDGTQAQATASSAQTSAGVSSLALQVSLNQVDPVNFDPLLGTSPAVTVTGNATAGTVDLDFGVGTTINGATVSGLVTSTYVVAGGTTTVVVTYTNVGIVTAQGGSATANGTLTVVATIAGSTATGVISGSVTYDTANDTRTVSQNMVYTLDTVAGTTTWTGTTTVTSSIYGVWTATYAGVEMTTTAANRQIYAGTITMTRTNPIPVTAVMIFTGVNTGDLIVTPPGIPTTFTL